MTEPADLRHVGLDATLPRLKILELFQNGSQRHYTGKHFIRLPSRPL